MKELGWDDLKKRRRLARLIYIYKAFMVELAWKEISAKLEKLTFKNWHVNKCKAMGKSRLRFLEKGIEGEWIEDEQGSG